MLNHRYTQFMLPLERYIAHLSPLRRKLLACCEGGLLLLLLTSVSLYL